MNNNDILDKKTYAKYDKTYMVFGSIMNNMQGKFSSEEEVEKFWQLAKKLNAEFIDELYSAPVIDSEEKPL